MQSRSGRALLDEARSAFQNSSAELNTGRRVVTGAQTHNLANHHTTITPIRGEKLYFHEANCIHLDKTGLKGSQDAQCDEC